MLYVVGPLISNYLNRLLVPPALSTLVIFLLNRFLLYDKI